MRLAPLVVPFLTLLAGCVGGVVSSDSPFGDRPIGDQNEAGVAFACPDVDIGDAALCVCDDFAKAGSNLEVNGHVGVNGHTSFEGSNPRTAGTFIAHGGMDIAGSNAQVGEDLVVGADLTGTGSNLSVAGELQVAGEVTGFTGYTAGSYPGGGAPCACGSDQVVDVAALVAEKAASGTARTLSALGSNEALTLDAGEYTFDALEAEGSNVHLDIQGAVSLYVEGSLAALGSNEAITLAEGASLDLYVSDVVHAVGSNIHFENSSPGAFRLYMGGAGGEPLLVGSNGRFDGVVYAPAAELDVSGSNADFRGALFAKRLVVDGSNVRIDYADPSPDNCVPPDDEPEPEPEPEPEDPGDGDIE